MKARPIPFWASIFTVLGVIVLCALGAWQVQRLAWKTDIIEALDTAYSGQNAASVFERIFSGGDFIYGTVEGVFLADKAIALGPRIRDDVISHDVIVPLDLGGQTLFVNLGFNPYPPQTILSAADTISHTPPVSHILEAYQGKIVSFQGLARAPRWNSFTPENETQNEDGSEHWYKADVEEMAAVRGLENPMPFIFYAEASSVDLEPFPNNQRWTPKNNHLQYAIFWFTMAVALIVVYVLRFIKKA